MLTEMESAGCAAFNEEVQQFKRRNMKIRFDYEISWGAKASEILEQKEKNNS